MKLALLIAITQSVAATQAFATHFEGQGCFALLGKTEVLKQNKVTEEILKKPKQFHYHFSGTEKNISLELTDSKGQRETRRLDWDSQTNSKILFLETIKLPSDTWTYYYTSVSIDAVTGKVEMKGNAPVIRFRTVEAHACSK